MSITFTDQESAVVNANIQWHTRLGLLDMETLRVRDAIAAQALVQYGDDIVLELARIDAGRSRS